VALWSAPALFRPFNPHCAALTTRWAALHDGTPSLWSPELLALDAPLFDPVLLHAQRLYGHHLAGQWLAALLTSAPSSFEGS
jgi:hypothetical protein